MHKLTLLSFLFLLFAENAVAQHITGKVVDAKTLETLPYANVVAYSADSVLVMGCVTDSVGFFSLNAKADFVEVSYVGYNNKRLTINNQTNIGIVPLEIADEQLREIIVEAQVPQFSVKPSGIVANVDGTLLSYYGSMDDMLNHIPLVSFKNDELNVFGKGSALLYVDGQPIVANVADVISQLSPANIKSIDVVTNPGPEYAADVRSVVKITTLRSGEGFGALVQTEWNFAHKVSNTDLISLNFRHGGLDIFGSVKFDFSRGRDYAETTDNFLSNNILYTEKDTSTYKGRRWLTSFGFSQKAENKLFGAKYVYSNLPKYDTDNVGEASIADTVSRPYFACENSNAAYHDVSAYYEGEIANDVSLRIDADYAQGNNATSNARVEADEAVVMNAKNNYKVAAIKAQTQISNALGGNVNIGADYAYTNDKQKLSAEPTSESVQIVEGENTSEQNLYAVFASYNSQIGDFSVDCGLRYEHSNLNYSADDDEQSKTYKGLYPNATIAYQGEALQTSLSYKRSLTKPNYEQLRNTTSYVNQYNYKAGNPNLKPCVNNELTAMVGYNEAYAMITMLRMKNFVADDYQLWQLDKLLYKPLNIKHFSLLTMSAGYSKEAGLWSVDVEMNAQIQKLKNASNKPLLMCEITNYFECGPLVFNVSLSGNTRGDILYATYKPKLRTDCGVSARLFDRKMRIVVSANDIFRKDYENWKINKEQFSVNYKGYADVRSVNVSLVYMFNYMRSRFEGKSASDEFSRVQSTKNGR